MNPRSVARQLSYLLAIYAGSMLIPLLVALWYDEMRSALACGGAFAVTAAVGIGLRLFARVPSTTVYRREAVAVVGIGWFTITVLGSLPFYFDNAGFTLVDALFECASGLTTTGATILTDVEKLSHALLLWRSLTHWLGGMGIIVLFVAIFPQLGVGARRMFASEVPGPITEGLKPKIRETSAVLWRLYLGLTLAEIVALWLCGMDMFNAVCHALATMATGGFSTRNGSIADFNNPAVEWVVILFMIAAGTNFSLYFALLRGRWTPVRQDVELRTYLLLIAIVTAVVSVDILGRHPDLATTVRAALFQTVSIVTTTGFGTDNFDAYPALSKVLLVCLMFIGGSAGSTAGGIKVSRVLVVLKSAWTEVVRSFSPQSVVRVRLGQRTIPEDIVRGILAFFGLFMVLFAIGTAVMAALGLDLVTAATAVVATLGNIGPGLGRVGALENYAFIPDLGKLVLTFLMILGRLELLTILALASRSLWVR